MSAERRQFDRYLPDGIVFAFMRPDFRTMGEIKNISQGGVAFEYIATCDEVSHSNLSMVDILSYEKDFYLPHLPCKVVYDAKTNGTGTRSFIGLHTRICGLEFETLTDEQATLLSSFITHHTCGLL